MDHMDSLTSLASLMPDSDLSLSDDLQLSVFQTPAHREKQRRENKFATWGKEEGKNQLTASDCTLLIGRDHIYI